MSADKVCEVLQALAASLDVAPFSYGLAVAPDDTGSADELINVADEAQYEMKRAHKAELVDPAIDHPTTPRLTRPTQQTGQTKAIRGRRGPMPVPSY
jgi:hypothetical protein